MDDIGNLLMAGMRLSISRKAVSELLYDTFKKAVSR